MKQLKISAVDFDGNQKEAAGTVQNILERWAFRQDWNLENWDMVTSVELDGRNILKSDRLTFCDVAEILGFTGLWSDFVKQSAHGHMSLTDRERFRKWFSDRYRLYWSDFAKQSAHSHMSLTDRERFRKWFSDRYRLYESGVLKYVEHVGITTIVT